MIPFKIEKCTLDGTLAFYLSNIQWLPAYPLSPNVYLGNLIVTARGMIKGTPPKTKVEQPIVSTRTPRVITISIVVTLSMVILFITGYYFSDKFLMNLNLNEPATAKAIEMSVNKEATVKAMEIFATQTAELNRFQSIMETQDASTITPQEKVIIIYTATDIPLPTDLPTKTATPKPTIDICAAGGCTKKIPYDKGAKTWFPEISLMPEGMSAGSIRTVTNEEATSDKKSLELFKSWNRITSYDRFYSHQDGCDASNGLKGIYVQIIFFEDEFGSKSFFEWAHEGATVTMIDSLGENAYSYKREDEEECPVDAFSITFQRLNVIARIRVRSVEGKMDNAAMNNLASELAQYIDARFLEEAQ